MAASDEAAPTEVLEPGRVINRNFRIEQLLGQGAMGQVYLAEQLSLSKKVAIKVLHRHLASDPTLAKRFHREAKSASQLNHPNAIQIIDFGQDEDGALFIAMELLEGRDLGKIIRAEFPLPLPRMVRIVSQVLSALDEAHVKGVIHRDLKPENIMVMDRRGDPDFVKVCDFGIAKIQDPKSDAPESVVTMAGIVCGTPEYMSPEQARGETLDGRTDLYSVAVILYQMATGELPFTAASALGVVTKHLTEQAVPPRQRRPELDIPPALEALILRGMDKHRQQRPESALSMKRLLEALLEPSASAGAVGADAGVAAAPASGAAIPATMAAPVATAPTVAATPASSVDLDRPPRSRMGLVIVLGVVLLAAAAVASVTLFSGAPPVVAVAAPADAGGATLGADRAPPDASPVVAVSPPLADAAPAEASGDDAAAATATTPATPTKPTRPLKPTTPIKPTRPTKPAKPAKPKPTTPAVEPPAPPPDLAKAVATAERGFKEILKEAEGAIKKGQIQEAVRLFEEARKRNPKSPRVHKMLGKCYNLMGRSAAAKRSYRRYLELAPNARDAAFIRAMIK